jgi:hypothetical protein
MTSQLKNIIVLRDLIREHGCPQFASFTKVTDPSGARLTPEKARHVLLLGADFTELYEKDKQVLEALLPSLTGLAQEACEQLLASRQHKPGTNPASTTAEAYEYVDCPGLKVHIDTNELHIMGLKVSKVVIGEPSKYRHVKSRPLTIEKDKIREMLPSSRIRQFNLGDACTVKIDGQTLNFETPK